MAATHPQSSKPKESLKKYLVLKEMCRFPFCDFKSAFTVGGEVFGIS